MCYLPPGPRCSNHAQAALEHAIKAVEEESNIDRKIRLQMKVDEARTNFYSTPRGQNELKKEITLLTGSNDPDFRTKLWQLKHDLLLGEETRKNQLAALSQTKQARQSEIKEAVGTRNRNDIVTAVTFNALLQSTQNLEAEVHITSPNTIELTSAEETFKILCLPDKFQTIWDTFHTIDGQYFSDNPLDAADMKRFVEIFNTNLTYTNLDPKDSKVVKDWIAAKLEQLDISLVSYVDRRTENIVFINPKEMTDFYSADFKLAKRLGGTTVYRNEPSELEKTLEDSIFAGSAIEQIRNSEGVLLKTVLLHPEVVEEKARSVGNVYLSWHTAKNDGYYEVRAKHKSTKFNLKVVLRKHDRIQTESDLALLEHLLATLK